MSTLSLRQYLRRRGADPQAGIRHLRSGPLPISIRYLLTSVTCVQNLIDGNQVLPRLHEDLRLAQREINVAIYMFCNDPIGAELADILITKASDRTHPVRVRVLLNVGKTRLNHPFIVDDTWGMINRMRAGGVEVLDTGIDYDRVIVTGHPQFDGDEQDIRNTISIDAAVVDHRKFVTIDGTVAYCGSANFAYEYLYHLPFDPGKVAKDEAEAAQQAHLPEAWEKWHDGLVRFAGPLVPQLNATFRERWVLDGGQDFEPAPFDASHPAGLDGYPVDNLSVVLGQPSGRPNAVLALFKQMIDRAGQSIFIENPYLYHPVIVDALVAAKQRTPALRVDLILPDEKLDDSKLSSDVQRFRYQRYIPVGIHVFEYQNHFNHLKIATFDERYAIIGSANLNYRSLENDRDFELVILMDSPPFAQAINAHVRDVDISRSRQFKREDVEGFGSYLWAINTRNPATLAAEAARIL